MPASLSKIIFISYSSSPKTSLNGTPCVFPSLCALNRFSASSAQIAVISLFGSSRLRTSPSINKNRSCGLKTNAFLSKDSLVSMVPSFLCIRHGHESMRLRSSVHEPQNHEVMVTKVQAEGNRELRRGRNAGCPAPPAQICAWSG